MPKLKRISTGVVFIVALFVVLTAIGSSAPGDFPGKTTVTVPKGQTLSDAGKELFDKGLIRSQILFKAYVTLLDKTSGVKTGEYNFTKPESVLRIASRLVKGEFGFPIAKVTIPEGSASSDIAVIIKKAIPGFAAADFAVLAKPYEGRLFPETYFWQTNVTPERIIADMTALFKVKMFTIRNGIESFGKSESDVLIMASIVEREAASSTDRRIVAGILWKRLSEGMALQVDAPFYYLLRKPSEKLTTEDLKLKSPYNLYTHTGLTPTPITNPGLSAIVDTINPKKTAYWYFLSDKDGEVHYAKTLDEHVANKYKYLD